MMQEIANTEVTSEVAEGVTKESWLVGLMSRLWVPLQNVILVIAALVIPSILNLPPGLIKLSGATMLLILITLRSSRGRKARMAQFFYGYSLACMLFGYSRAFADQTPWANSNLNSAFNLENAIFQGQLPTARLQRLFFDPTHLGPLDYFLTSIYGSFIVVPLVIGVIFARKDWERTRRFLLAQMYVFILGSAIIYAIPSNPPWLSTHSTLNPNSDPENRVYRVTTMALGQGDDYAYGADQNRVAAMPSIHMANTFLLFVFMWGFGKASRIAGGLYFGIMAFALIYLGEHYVVDALAGIMLTSLCWRLAYAWHPHWREYLSLSRWRLRSVEPFPVGLAGTAQVGD